jgi:hypothetical protein
MPQPAGLCLPRPHDPPEGSQLAVIAGLVKLRLAARSAADPRAIAQAPLTPRCGDYMDKPASQPGAKTADDERVIAI